MLHPLLLATVAAVAPWLMPARFEAGAFYHPTANHAPVPAGCEEVTFPTTDGLSLHGWFMPARGRAPGAGTAPTVLHAHGNTGDVANHRGVCAFLQDAGFHVLLFDYRGFGNSDPARGLLRREWLVEDTAAAIDYLLTRPDVDHDRLAVFGYSLGAVLGMAATAERERVRAVVEYAGFATWRGVAADKAGLLGRLLIGRGHDAIDSAAALGDRPLLIVHGTRDGLVRQYHADRIAAAAAGAGVRVEQLRVEGGTHISLGSDARVRERVVGFLTRELGTVEVVGE